MCHIGIFINVIYALFVHINSPYLKKKPKKKNIIIINFFWGT